MTERTAAQIAQADAARARANAVRSSKAALKRSLKAREIRLGEALTDWCTQRASVEDLVRSVGGFGPSRAKAILREAGVEAGTQVGSLNEQQRRHLDEAIARRVRNRAVDPGVYAGS